MAQPPSLTSTQFNAMLRSAELKGWETTEQRIQRQDAFLRLLAKKGRIIYSTHMGTDGTIQGRKRQRCTKTAFRSTRTEPL